MTVALYGDVLLDCTVLQLNVDRLLMHVCFVSSMAYSVTSKYTIGSPVILRTHAGRKFT
jgi:hypothetical protein